MSTEARCAVRSCTMTHARLLSVLVLAPLLGCRSTAEIKPEVPAELRAPTPPPTSTEAAPQNASLPSAYEVALRRLLGVRSLKCEFTASASVNWDSGSPRGEGGNDHLAIHFDTIDVKKGEARVIGNQIATDVVAAATTAGLTFVERTEAGNFIMTTVVPWRGNEGDFAAVMSRHIVLVGFYKPPMVSQLYGSCRILQ